MQHAEGRPSGPGFSAHALPLGRLTPAELDVRLRALKDLAAGKLRPALPENGK